MMIRTYLIMVWLALVSLGGPARVEAQSLKSQGESDIFAEGDVLSISVYGRNDLSGKYRVQPSGSVSLPLIGAVDLTGLTARDLESTLAKTWENRLGAPLSVSVEFAERAPFYILGDVSAPGAYPYRHGMTVLQAVATGGGLRQLANADPTLRMNLLRERERRAQALDVLAQRLVEKARLTAELKGASELSIPRRLAEIASAENINALVTRQTQLMKSREHQHRLQKSLLDQRSALAQLEIKAYEEQYGALEKQERIVSEELNRVEKLRNSGLGLQNSVFEMQLRVSSLSTDKIGVLAAVTRAKTALTTSQNGSQQLEAERRQNIEQALIDVERRILEAESIERGAAQQMRAAGLSLNDQKKDPQFSLQRVRDDGGPRQVGPSYGIRPGDVIEVWIPPDDLTGVGGSSDAASLDLAE